VKTYGEMMGNAGAVAKVECVLVRGWVSEG